MNFNDFNGLAPVITGLAYRLSQAHHPSPEAIMDKDRIAGSAKKTKGSVKEAIGKITGDSKTQAEGTAEKTAGQAQNAVGGIKDTVRDATKPR
jgi:uncharacterized protein YjbJ (UPF0337 family)